MNYQNWREDGSPVPDIKVEANVLKVRLLDETAEMEARLSPPQPGDGGDDPQFLLPSAKKKKTVSIKAVSVATSEQIETIEDVDEY